jgi:hypothetical protein
MGLAMVVCCTAIDEFEAETIIVDLMGAGLTDNDITVRLPGKPGGIAISVHTEDIQGATVVKSILSGAGGREIAIESEGGPLDSSPAETAGNTASDVGALLNYRRLYR